MPQIPSVENFNTSPSTESVIPIRETPLPFNPVIAFEVVEDAIRTTIESWPVPQRSQFAILLSNLSKQLCKEFNVEIKGVKLGT